MAPRFPKERNQIQWVLNWYLSRWAHANSPSKCYWKHRKGNFTDDDEDDKGSGHGGHFLDGGDDNDGFYSDRLQDSESSNV